MSVVEKIREACPVVNHERAGDDLQDDHSHRKHLACACMLLGDKRCGVKHMRARCDSMLHVDK